MLIGLCGSMLAGKQSVAAYLVDHAPECIAFTKVEELVDFITKRWQQRWVTTDIWDESVLEKLLRRPSFFLVSVDAPLSLRWQRCKRRCASDGQPSPSLAEFVARNDYHLYDQKVGLARLIDRADVRLVNRSDNLEQLHHTLEELDLTNEQRLRPGWDQYFMQLASLAAQRSNCMKRRVGSVLVREKRVISTGYNVGISEVVYSHGYGMDVEVRRILAVCSSVR
ncbi:MAG: hypothetical protein Q9215_001198 [Flavoplaca cf. flavocitrina]